MLRQALSCRVGFSSSGMVGRIAGLAVEADSYLPTTATEEFLANLSKAAIERTASANNVLPRQTGKATRAAIVEQMKNRIFLHPLVPSGFTDEERRKAAADRTRAAELAAFRKGGCGTEDASIEGEEIPEEDEEAEPSQPDEGEDETEGDGNGAPPPQARAAPPSRTRPEPPGPGHPAGSLPANVTHEASPMAFIDVAARGSASEPFSSPVRSDPAHARPAGRSRPPVRVCGRPSGLLRLPARGPCPHRQEDHGRADGSARPPVARRL